MELTTPVDGSSLLPLIHGDDADWREEAIAETPPAGWQARAGDQRRMWCLRAPPWKLIAMDERPRGPRRYELYNLIDDPGERRDRFGERPGGLDALRAKLDVYIERRYETIPAEDQAREGS